MLLELLAIVNTVNYLFLPRIIENVTVISVSDYTINAFDEHFRLGEYHQTGIIINKYPKCLRSGMDLSSLDVGEELNWVKYCYGLIGPCDYVIDYQTNDPATPFNHYQRNQALRVLAKAEVIK